MSPSRPDRIVLAAFVVFVVFAGANAIGVRFVLREMGPFWSAAIRFAIAGLLLIVYMIATRRPMPQGQRLTGTVLFGVVGFGLAYTFLYQALKDAPAGTTMLMLAIVPLLTVLLATVQGIERLRLLALAGAALARLFPAPFRPSIRQVGTSGMNEIGLSGRSSLGTSRNCTADQFRDHRLVVGLARDQSHKRGIIPVIPTGRVTFARRQKLRQSFLLALVRHASIIRSRSEPTEESTPW